MEAGFQFNIVSLIFLITSFVSILLAFITITRKDIAGIKYITFMSFLVFIWTMSNALEYATSDLDMKILFSKISYFGIAPSALTLLVFTARNTGLTNRIPLKYFNALYVVPLAVIIVVFTNDYHFFYWKSYNVVDGLYGKAIYYESGPGLWMLVVFSWLAFVISMYLMIKLFAKRKVRFNRPLILIIIAFLWPWIANFLYVSRMLPHSEIDWTPVAYLLTSIFIYISVDKYQLFDLAPLAKDMLFYSIQNPVIVVNSQLKLIDYNTISAEHFHLNGKIGCQVKDFIPEMQDVDFSDLAEKYTLRNLDSKDPQYFELRVSVIKSALERVKGYVLLFSDVTNEILQQEELLRSKHELQSLNEWKDKLFSILAHDLRNPFHSIIGLSEILLSNPNLPEKDYNEIIEGINYSAINSHALLENLFVWAKSQNENIKCKKVDFELYPLISTSIAETATNAKMKNISVKAKCPHSVTLHADQNMVNVIIRNFISNAIKFTPKDGSVIIEVVEEEDKHILSIIDNGIGMTEEKLAQVLEAKDFNSEYGTENEKGTGLGLIICKEFVHRLGGKLWAESKLGEGTTFSFSIPR